MTPEESRYLGAVSRGTATGELLRRFWVPAVLSSELLEDGSPVRVKLFGEPLVAVRVAEGREPPGRDPAEYRMRPASVALPCETASWAGAIAEAVDTPPETFISSV